MDKLWALCVGGPCVRIGFDGFDGSARLALNPLALTQKLRWWPWGAGALESWRVVRLGDGSGALGGGSKSVVVGVGAWEHGGV